MKFERVTGLNNTGLQIVQCYKEYQDIKSKDNPILLESLMYYITNKLKIGKSVIEDAKSEKELIDYISLNKDFVLSEKEQIAGSVEFAEKILDFKRLGIKSAMANAKTHCLVLKKQISFSMKQLDKNYPTNETFYGKQNFLRVFVDGYMRTNLKTYLSTISPTNYKIVLSDLVDIKKDSENYHPFFNLEFHIKVDELDDTVLSEIGNVILNMPNLT